MKWLIVILLFLTSCMKEGNKDITFLIKKGNHSSYGAFWMPKSTMHFYVMFPESCIYDLGNENQLDINKLFGMSTTMDVHNTSFRFGWRYNNNQIEIFKYTYVKKVRDYVLMGAVDIGEWNSFRIDLTNDSVTFHLNDIKYTQKQKTKAPLLAMYPYFGGDERAPHEMEIYFREP